ncbi:exocyst complex component 7 [Bemisia tabaci]|uniref:exocyst complex component 7 n=1 Tax=Bemisia tabaci TaxID=7038 RepID=UPI0008F99DBF|nr:PREDICTED: exocyst complex component 7 [Bemisia tabaci]
MLKVEETESSFGSKLEKETKNLALLKEQMERSSQITKGMVSILSSFENRLSKLEITIMPIYNETGNLQRRQQNIERTVAALDDVIGYYGVSKEVEVVIRAGPSGPEGLEQFLAAMTRLQQAQRYFEKSNPQSVELENVCSLFTAGIDALNREFKELLLKHSKPVSPITLLDLVANDEELFHDDCSSVGSLGHFSETVLSDLTRMADWLIAETRDEFMNIYARIRANILMKSLTLLKDHQKSGSGSSMQNVSAVSPNIRPKFPSKIESVTRSKASKRLQIFEKKANKMLLKASQTLENSTGLSLGNRRSNIHLENREDIVDEQEMENYLVTVVALQRLMTSEQSLMHGIIPLQHIHQVFQIIIQDALKTIVQDGKNIAARTKRCISHHDFGGAIIIFPILKHLLNLKPEFERVVEGCELNVRQQFASVVTTLHSTAAKGLEEFIENVRSDSGTALPCDGTIHQLTSDVLVFLEQLVDYTDTIGNVLNQDPTYSAALIQITSDTKSNLNNDKNKILLGIYIKKVLSQLNLTVVSKSETYSEPGVRAIFRLNNCHYVLKALQRSSLLELVSFSEPDCENNYYSMISTHKKAYLQCWNKVISHITALEDIPLQGGKLRDKDRNSVKERFAGFNKEIEEISRLQRGYSIPDVELRESIKRDNKEYILPKYNTFYDKFSCLNFSKNPEKYLKYAPEQVAALLDRFFDVAA